MKTLITILLLSAFISCNNTRSGKQTGSDKLGLDTTTDIYAVTGEDTAMNSAINKALNTLNEFDNALISKKSSLTNFAIKKRFKTPDGGGEHMWIAGIKLLNNSYHGFINNDADKTTEVKYGDSVIVRKDEITDWMYLENNVLRGGYTIRAIRDKMSPGDRIKMDQEMGFTIED
jgi:uncharacterized protein YegJ (DUF2314 family)